jgi:hypothetical protein
VIAGASAIGTAPPALLAQNDKPPVAPALKGPEVTDRNVPGAAPDFGMGANRRFNERVPPEVFRSALGVLTTDDAPEPIRATPEQREKFRTLVEGFEASVRKYRREHAGEIESLRKLAGEVNSDRPRRRGGRQDEMVENTDLPPEEQKAREEARGRLRELMARAPKIEDVYTQVWKELTVEQREAVQVTLDEWRERQAKDRENAYVRRVTGNRGDRPMPARPDASDDAMMKSPATAEKPAGTDAPRRAPSDDADPAAGRRARLLRLFARLTPQEQEQLLQRLEERSQERQRGAARGAGRGAEREAGDRPGRKPPPDPDSVNVPKPEDDKK